MMVTGSDLNESEKAVKIAQDYRRSCHRGQKSPVSDDLSQPAFAMRLWACTHAPLANSIPIPADLITFSLRSDLWQ